MKKLFYLTKRANGRFYVRFVDPVTGKPGTAFSTGETTLKAAEKAAFLMLQKNEHEQTAAQKIAGLLPQLDPAGVAELLRNMQKAGLIISATMPNAPDNISFYDFCIKFWDFENSDYVKEKQLYKQTIHKTYCKRNTGFVKKHFVFFDGLHVAEITRQKIKEFQLYLMKKNLSTESINQITRIATIPLKWAYQNGKTQNDCFTGLRFCAVTHKERKILDIETVQKLFKSGDFGSTYSKLANLVAMATGMRMGEIQALRRCDIGENCIYVRHNYVSKNGEGLKECKNGEEREIPISRDLRALLLKQVLTNPYKEGDEAFVFWGLVPGQPMDAKPWLTALRRALRSINYSNPKEICFHAWRHFYASTMAEVTPERKLQRATGHKTLAMLQHYANHAKKEDLLLIQQNEELLFSEIISLTSAQM